MAQQVAVEPPLVSQARSHVGDGRLAVVDGARTLTYPQLLARSSAAASTLLKGAADLDEARVAFLISPGIDHVVVQWGIWRAGGIAVPLALAHPEPELEYTIADSDASIVVVDAAMADRVAAIASRRRLRLLTTSELATDAGGEAPYVAPGRRALMLYTSGTTSRPKGVVTTHANIAAQVQALVQAWEWTGQDRILHFLPLHHIHGVINVLSCCLWSGAVCEFLPRFEPAAVWDRLVQGNLSLFMAVPTIYAKLIAAWEEAPADRRQQWSEGARRLRLMVSGSAALPVSVLEKWRDMTGHTLLERYGMTEIGMALSNPLRGERRPGHVGLPLPGVEARLVDDSFSPIEREEVAGQIQVRGPAVFQEYWRRPEATAQSFRDGWFNTGDVARISRGYYRILGRSSVDIIKTGGEKVSALEIEEALREHPAICECAVVGVEDPEWGQLVSAAVILRDGAALTLDELRTWGKERLAVYKVPRNLRVVNALPRNGMGKVVKPDVVKLF